MVVQPRHLIPCRWVNLQTAFVVAGLLTGCGRQRVATSMFATVDSVPFFDVQSTETGVQLAGVVAAFSTPNGTIVVGDSVARLVAIIDTATRTISQIGRVGDGPGEFRSVDWIGQCRRNSIYTWDRRRTVANVFDDQGHFAREIHFATPPWRIRCGLGADRLVAIDQPQMVGDPISEKPLYASSRFLSFDGDSLDAISHIKIGESRALGHLTQVAIDSTTLYVGTSDSFSVDRYSLEGILEPSLRIGGTLRAPADSDFERELHAVGVTMGGTDTAATARIYRHLFGAVPLPAFMPAYGNLLLDPAGNVWVDLSRPGQSTATWRVTSNGGAGRGDITLPSGFRMMRVGAQALLGALETPDGAEHVVMYRYRR